MFKDIIDSVKRGELKYYNFYNTDMDLQTYFSVDYYQKNKKDNIELIDQKIHKLFIDIEIYKDDPEKLFEFDKSDFPVSAITVICTKENIFKSYILLHPDIKGKFNPDTKYYLDILLERKYIKQTNKLEIYTFTDELELIKACWGYVRNIDPTVLSGWNSDEFDLPYIYRRLLILMQNNKKEVDKLLSRFETVELRNKSVNIIEFGSADLMVFYKPRAERGLNYGDTLSSYSLDFVSDHVLNLQKFEYKGTNKNLDEFYKNDPTNYLLYNIVDTALLVLLDDKLKHIELHNLLRRMQNVPYTRSLIGNSSLYDAHIFSKITSANKFIRHGISAENTKDFSIDDFRGITIPKLKTGSVTPIEITGEEYRSVVGKFEGAYVKDSYPGIIKDCLIMDLDATALYPSMILQSNIGFDTYRARIISPIVYKLLETLNNTLGKQDLQVNLSLRVFDMVNKYVDTESSIQNKEKSRKYLYFIINKFMKVLYDSKCSFKNIINPTSEKENILLTKYLIPLCDLIETIHEENKEYNIFMYDFLFEDEEIIKKKYQYLYIIKDTNIPNQKIEKLSLDDSLNFMKNYSLTITGCCFTKHDEYSGMFTNTLINMKKMRNDYKKNMYKFPDGSDEFGFWNSRQLSVKIAMNSIYGVMGLKTFRYSNHWLAKSITIQGRLTLKMAQYITEKHLENEFK